MSLGTERGSKCSAWAQGACRDERRGQERGSMWFSKCTVKHVSGGWTGGGNSCLENPMARGACQASILEVAKSRMRLSTLVLVGRREKDAWKYVCPVS